MAAVTALLAFTPAAGAQYPPSPAPQAAGKPAAKVDANGNVITGALSFTPFSVTVPVGGVVRWTNTDFIAPHTATEDHGLWDLGGTYGQTPLNPSGFAPGTTVERAFEAGTAHYFCRVHPVQMHGIVAVPVGLALEKKVVKRRVKRPGHGRRRTVRRTVYTVIATWATQAPASGEVFDVEIARGGSAFRPLLTGTAQTQARIPAPGRAMVTHVRARLRKAADTTAATDWSPDASVTTP